MLETEGLLCVIGMTVTRSDQLFYRRLSAGALFRVHTLLNAAGSWDEV